MKKINYNYVFAILAYLLFSVFVYFNLINPILQVVLQNILINIILAISLNLIIGLCGQFSLGHAGFMAIGAYSLGVVVKQFGNQYSFLGIAIGVVISIFAALLISVPTLRLKGDYLAIATLGFGETIRIIIQNMEITNGAIGLILPKIFSLNTLVLVTILSYILLMHFKNSKYGRSCIAIKEDELASSAVGINPLKFKIIAFVVGGAIASIAGSLYAGSLYIIKPDIFTFNKSIDILAIVVFGGIGSFSGSVIASIVLAIINFMLQSFPGIRTIIYGVLLVLIMIFKPSGLLDNKEINLNNFFNFFKRGKKS